MMIVAHEQSVEKIEIKNDQVKDVMMRILVSEKEGWDSHVMRVFEVEPGGYTPRHQHDWPHINYVLEGSGQLFLEGEMKPLEKGSFAYVESNHLHQFQNTGDEILKFICIVPKRGQK